MAEENINAYNTEGDGAESLVCRRAVVFDRINSAHEIIRTQPKLDNPPTRCGSGRVDAPY